MEKASHPQVYVFTLLLTSAVLGSNSIEATNIICTDHVNYIISENLSEGRKDKEREEKQEENVQSHH